MLRRVFIGDPSSASVLWFCLLSLCVVGCFVSSQVDAHRSSLADAPVRVSHVQTLQQKLSSSENGTTILDVVDPHAAHVRLPWAVSTILADYYYAGGMGTFWQKQLKLDEEGEEKDDTQETLFTSKEGGQWSLLQSISSSTSDMQYLYANNKTTHSQLLQMLGQGSFDSLLESIGQFWDLQHGITLYSLGFMGATYNVHTDITGRGGESNSNLFRQAHAVPSPSSRTNNNTPRSFQILIPLYLKEGSRPELQVQSTTITGNNQKPVKIKQELDIAYVLGDTTSYGPGTFDYRDSPGEFYMAFSLYFWVHGDDDNTAQPSQDDNHHLPSFALEWIHSSTGHHWNQNDPSVSLQQQVCDITTTSTGEEGEENVCQQNQHDSAFFWDNPRSYNWLEWTFQDFRDNLECSHILNEYDSDGDDDSSTTDSGQPKHRRQPPTLDDWKKLREIYVSIVGPDQSTLPLEQENLDSFFVKVTAKPSVPGRGRGIFADQFIPKGTLVYTPQQQARFSNGDHYKQFVMSVSVEMACDLLAWVSIQKVFVDGVEQPPMIVVDLDDGALVNTGYRRESLDDIQEGDEIANVGCLPDLAAQTTNGCAENDFALEDIQAGEELLIDYSEYVVVDKDVWISFGLGDPRDFEDEFEEGDDSSADDEAADDNVDE